MPHMNSCRRTMVRIAAPAVLGIGGLLAVLSLRPGLGLAQERPAATQPADEIQQQYRQRFSALDSKDVKGHYTLAEWCREKADYRLLLRQADYVLELDPDHENARLLRRIAVREIARHPAVGGAARPEGEEPESIDSEYVNAAQIQKIRYAEMLRPPDHLFRLLDDEADDDEEEDDSGEDDDGPFDDDRPRAVRSAGRMRETLQVRFGENVLRDFLDQMSGHPDFSGRDARIRFMKLTPTQQVQLIRHHTGDKYAKRIEIANDPVVVREFKRVLPVVQAGCATSACHGGVEAKGFRIRTGRPDTDANLYTNFLILNRVSKGKDRLINRTSPEDSLILEYGLPARYAEKSHPLEIPELYPRGPEDPRYQIVLKWIEALTVPAPRTGVSLPGYPEPPPPGAGIGRPATEEGGTAPGK